MNSSRNPSEGMAKLIGAEQPGGSIDMEAIPFKNSFELMAYNCILHDTSDIWSHPFYNLTPSSFVNSL